ncbi:MAG: hypothetical protein GQ474_09740, partial [Sulfurimonas sp.]|nr:hypothetical protein [Sulfurimonas sp.]
MANLTPVDFDPFNLTPVEGDPFNQTQALATASPATGGNLGAGGLPQPINQSQAVKGLIKQTTGVDKEKGVDDAIFRAGWSRTDTDAEKALYLNERVGKGNWSIDKAGDYIVDPVGLQKIGITDEFARPVDEAGFALQDLADFAGDAPAIAGAIGGSLMGTGLGATQGVLLAGAGAALGKAVDETVEYFEGKNLQTAEEVGTDIAIAGAEGLVGEGVFRGAAGIGRKLLAPNAKNMTPEMIELAKQANELGVKVTPAQVSGNSLVARFQGLADQVLGSDVAAQNAAAFEKTLAKLGAGRGNRGEAVEALIKNIEGARQSLREWSKAAFGAVDDATGGKPFIPTRRYKEA